MSAVVEFHSCRHFNWAISTWLGFCLLTCLQVLVCVRGNMPSSAILGTQVSSFCVYQGQRLLVHQHLFSPSSTVAGCVVPHYSTFPQPPLQLDMAWDWFCYWMISGSDSHHFQLWPPCFFPDAAAQGNIESPMLKVEELPLTSGYSNDKALPVDCYICKKGTFVVLESLYCVSVCHRSLAYSNWPPILTFWLS